VIGGARRASRSDRQRGQWCARSLSLDAAPTRPGRRAARSVFDVGGAREFDNRRARPHRAKRSPTCCRAWSRVQRISRAAMRKVPTRHPDRRGAV